MAQFVQGFGRWAGTAEVFSGEGRFLGNGADQRHVQDVGDGRTRIDVSFVGPFKHAGHYFIQDNGDHRLYQGPANVGYAEVLSESLVDANAYWPALGLSQRFFLMVIGDLQLSLALMSRGEQLLYAVVGQNDRVPEGAANPLPSLVSGTSYDLGDDPHAGRGRSLLHREGRWTGDINLSNAARQPVGALRCSERCERLDARTIRLTYESGHAPHSYSAQFVCNEWQAWSVPEQPMAGSYSLFGGRAAVSHLHVLDSGLRAWCRDVVSHDGERRAFVRHWYRGGERVSIEHGVLQFVAS
jgi:hypothetical protein